MTDPSRAADQPIRDVTVEQFTAGRVVQCREVLHGDLWLTHPVTVVDDRDGVRAVLLAAGIVPGRRPGRITV